MPTDREYSAQELVNKEVALAFYDAALNRKDADAACALLGPEYLQHNPKAQDGVEGFRTFVATLRAATPESQSEIKQVFVDGNVVILHVHKIPEPGTLGVAIIDLFRLADGKIVEHWDVTQQIPSETASGNSMF
ncbi:MAG TPA: nuclear transport factor 2 family protein [Gemmatimonadaceae bacterium]|jgi:predicted SnoaL-like aldol condensation-catalyzing enzyme|nr:nuclear transport factor 2 family protein [Gemmatimonadaceae bacterium]